MISGTAEENHTLLLLLGRQRVLEARRPKALSRRAGLNHVSFGDLLGFASRAVVDVVECALYFCESHVAERQGPVDLLSLPLQEVVLCRGCESLEAKGEGVLRCFAIKKGCRDPRMYDFTTT